MSATNGSQRSPRCLRAAQSTSRSAACHWAVVPAAWRAASRSISRCSLRSAAVSRELPRPRRTGCARSSAGAPGGPGRRCRALGAGGEGGRRNDIYPRRGLAAGRRRGVLQEPSAFRLADGQHGPDRAAARLWNLGILDPPAPCACVAIDRAYALRQGEPLGSAPCSREIITIGRDHGGPHDAAHGRDDGAAGDMHDLALPRSGTSAHNSPRAAHRRAECRPAQRYRSPAGLSGPGW